MDTFHRFNYTIIGEKIKWETINYFGDTIKTITGIIFKVCDEQSCLYCHGDDNCDYLLQMKDLELFDARFELIE